MRDDVVGKTVSPTQVRFWCSQPKTHSLHLPAALSQRSGLGKHRRLREIGTVVPSARTTEDVPMSYPGGTYTSHAHFLKGGRDRGRGSKRAKGSPE